MSLRMGLYLVEEFANELQIGVRLSGVPVERSGRPGGSSTVSCLPSVSAMVHA